MKSTRMEEENASSPRQPIQQQSKAGKSSSSSPTKKPRVFRSPFFPIPPSPSKPRRPPPGLPVTPMPPLFSPSFGLIQEELSHDPFRLLIAVTFLIKVSAKVALPIFGRFIERFPTPESLASEDVKSEIQDFIKPLGLAKNRRRIIQKYARGWLSNPPTREKRYVVRSYMYAGAATAEQIRDGEEFGPESAEENEQDARKRTTGLAWEIGHLTKGSYALDSWRIFCRDELLGRSKHWKGNPSQDGFQPEWMRVLPGDKELRACLRWMWMREGWEWDPATGEKEPLRDEMRKAVNVGRVGYDESGGLVILDNN